MAQCEGTTKAGARCKRPASEGSRFCAAHRQEEPQPKAEPRAETRRQEAVADEDWGVILVAAAAVGAVLLLLGGWRRWIPKL